MGEDSVSPAFLAIWGKSDLGWGTVTETVSELSFHLALCSAALFDAEKETSGMGVRQIHPPDNLCRLRLLGGLCCSPRRGFCGFSPGPWDVPSVNGCSSVVAHSWFHREAGKGSGLSDRAVLKSSTRLPGVWLGDPSLHWRVTLQEMDFLVPHWQQILV